MKKLSLIAFLIAGMGASQAFAVDDNYSKIDQITSTNATATVTQTGVNKNTNWSSIRQDTVNQATATVTQVQSVFNSGKENKSDIQQSGSWIEATVTQDGAGNNNDSKIKQDGQGVNGNANNLSTISIDQTGLGNENFSNVLNQKGAGLEIEVTQTGIGNDNTSTIKQEANRSSVKVEQRGVGNDNTSTVNQFADDSSVDVQQGMGTVGLVHTSVVFQSGSHNHATVIQK